MTKNNNKEIKFEEKPVKTFNEAGNEFFIDLDGKTTVQLDENGRVEQVSLPDGGVIKFSVDKYGMVWSIDFPRGGKISTYLEKPESAKTS
jgi:sugar lactone lactonase YvrE